MYKLLTFVNGRGNEGVKEGVKLVKRSA